MEEPTEDLVKVAYLKAMGLGADEIAQLITASTSKVNKLVAKAKKEGWLVQAYRHNAKAPISEEKLEQLYYFEEDKEELKRRIDDIADAQKCLPPTDVHVVYAGENADYDIFANNVGAVVWRILCDGKTKSVAVAWGRTIEAIVKGARIASRKQSSGDKDNQPHHFMPIAGDPFNHPASGYSPTKAAEVLQDAFRANEEHLSLFGVAARVPKKMADHTQTIRDFLFHADDYRWMFCNPKKAKQYGNLRPSPIEAHKSPYIPNVNAVITGIGDAKSSEKDPWFRATCEAEDMTDKQFGKITSGNIAGVWLPRDKSHQAQIDDINSRWLGIRQDDLRECHRSTTTKGTAGNLVCAIGKEKLNIVKQTLGFATHLIIDNSLATAILNSKV